MDPRLSSTGTLINTRQCTGMYILATGHVRLAGLSLCSCQLSSTRLGSQAILLKSHVVDVKILVTQSFRDLFRVLGFVL